MNNLFIVISVSFELHIPILLYFMESNMENISVNLVSNCKKKSSAFL